MLNFKKNVATVLYITSSMLVTTGFASATGALGNQTAGNIVSGIIKDGGNGIAQQAPVPTMATQQAKPQVQNVASNATDQTALPKFDQESSSAPVASSSDTEDQQQSAATDEGLIARNGVIYSPPPGMTFPVDEGWYLVTHTASKYKKLAPAPDQPATPNNQPINNNGQFVPGVVPGAPIVGPVPATPVQPVSPIVGPTVPIPNQPVAPNNQPIDNNGQFVPGAVPGAPFVGPVPAAPTQPVGPIVGPVGPVAPTPNQPMAPNNQPTDNNGQFVPGVVPGAPIVGPVPATPTQPVGPIVGPVAPTPNQPVAPNNQPIDNNGQSAPGAVPGAPIVGPVPANSKQISLQCYIDQQVNNGPAPVGPNGQKLISLQCFAK